MALSNDHPAHGLTETLDFYSLSMCRDLLFHVQERRYTIPDIKSMTRKFNLQFMGFNNTIAPVLKGYHRRFPQDHTLSDLDNWAVYEEENPNSFIGMYVFWLKRAPLERQDAEPGSWAGAGGDVGQA